MTCSYPKGAGELINSNSSWVTHVNSYVSQGWSPQWQACEKVEMDLDHSSSLDHGLVFSNCPPSFLQVCLLSPRLPELSTNYCPFYCGLVNMSLQSACS